MGLTHPPALHFLHPAWLLVLPVLWLLVASLTRSSLRDGNWSRVMDSELLSVLRIEERRRGQAPWLLLGAAWTLTVLALAGPAWHQTESVAFRAPAAWVLLLDLSPSMAATDVSPNRVTRARYVAADLLASAHDARVGLVAFAGEPHTVAPLTTDIATVRMLLQPLAPGLMPESGDRLAPALEEAAGLLDAGQARHGQIVVLSDGVSDPTEALRVAQRLRQQGTTVNIIGVGTPSGAPEPDGKGDFVHTPDGRLRMTRLQSDELRNLASAGGGEFVRVSGLSGLLTHLEKQQSHDLDTNTAQPPSRLAIWQNGGVWLLPPLLLLAALFARRGWI
jgi:Ca-activated chloride channel family protein